MGLPFFYIMKIMYEILCDFKPDAGLDLRRNQGILKDI